MVRIGCPEQTDKYYMTQNPEIIFKLHQANCMPTYRDEDCVYFKKNAKLKKVLAKLNIELDLEL